MKLLLTFLLFTIVFSTVLSAQTNNPYDSSGKKITENIVILYNDYKDGKITDYSQETIDRYAETFSIDTTIPVELISTIYPLGTDSTFNYSAYIDNSDLSQDAKTISLEIINLTRNDITTESFRRLLVAKVDEINSSSLSETEKRLLLLSCAAIHRLSTLPDQNLYGRRIDDLQTGTVIGVAVGIVVGGIIGAAFCGPWCSFGGSIIFGFFGGLLAHSLSN